VVPQLRDWFPNARIVGWKYELSGTSTGAFTKAWRQINESRTDGGILNGSAYGNGFAFCHPSGDVRTWNDLDELCSGLQQWLDDPDSLDGPAAGRKWSPQAVERRRHLRIPQCPCCSPGSDASTKAFVLPTSSDTLSHTSSRIRSVMRDADEGPDGVSGKVCDQGVCDEVRD
jgi:hypothetical protein